MNDDLDPMLLALNDAVEAGRAMPVLTMWTEAQQIVGLPSPRRVFADHGPFLADSSAQVMSKNAPRKERQGLHERQRGDFEALWRDCYAQASAGPWLTLSSAVVWAFGDTEGVKVPVIRLPISKVVTWWPYGAGEAVKGGSEWWVGVAVPLGN